MNGRDIIVPANERRQTEIIEILTDYFASNKQSKFLFDANGRLSVSSIPASIEPITGTITANGQVVSIDVSKASNVVFYCTGSFVGVNCAFEASIDGGTSWFSVQAVRTNSNTVERWTGVLSSPVAYAWELSVNGYTNYRVVASAFVTGTQTWTFQLGSYATEPIPAVQGSTVMLSGNPGVTLAPLYSAGYSLFHKLISQATVNATNVKGSPSSIGYLSIINLSASSRYFKIYNKVSAPTVGVDTPALIFLISANTTREIAIPAAGLRLTAGFSYAITGGISDTDTTAIGAGEVIVNAMFV